MTPDSLHLGDELEPLTTPAIDRLKIAYMAVAMRDPNEVHVEPDAAAAAGLPQTIAHGTFAQAYLGAAVTRLAGVAALDALTVQLTAPVFPGDRLTVTGRVTEAAGAQRTAELSAAREDGTVVARGSARFTLGRDG